MTTSVSGSGSGWDYQGWVDFLVSKKQADITKVSNKAKAISKQESTLSSLKTNYSDLLTAIENLTQSYSSKNVFNQKTATSSSDAITAKADSNAVVQSVKVSVTSLASATTAKSASVAASYVDENTKLSDVSGGALKKGTFSVYVGGEKHDITIDPTSNDTLGNVLANLNGIEGVSATLTDGKLTITKSGASDVTVGSSSDDSNFSNVMSLMRTGAEGESVYSSSKSIFDTNASAALTQTPFANGTVTQGTFTIGNANFTIDATKTLDVLIKEINATAGKKDDDGNSIEAGVTARWDSNLGKIILTADEEGASNINIKAGTSNFTDIMGLTESTWNPDGSVATTKLATGSQKLGDNAVLTINDTEIKSASNTVTSDISGIKGLTLTLNKETSSDATVEISPDANAASDAITAFVNAFNTLITNTDSATKSKTNASAAGDLYGDSFLSTIRNNLRKTATASINGDSGYKTLASIGITTGAIGTDVTTDTGNISKLVIDTNKLTSALETDPEAVMKLLEGDSSTGTKGVLTNLSDILEKPLDPAKGYFAKRDATLKKQEEALDGRNGKIEQMNKSLELYKTQLEAKYRAIDNIISNLQSSAASFNSYFNNNNNNNNNS